MALTSQTIHNGDRYTSVKVHITDNAGGEYTDGVLFDLSAFDANAVDASIIRLTASLTGFAATLHWDATSNVDILQLPEGEDIYNFEVHGGLANNSTTGKTGDILISTTGLAAGDEGTIILELKKKY